MKKNRLISIILSAVISVAALSPIGASAADVNFPDMPNDWSTAALTAAVENGLLTGSDGYLLPKDNLTRAQMAAIIVRAFAATKTVSLSEFTDVPAGQWYYEPMQKAVAMGVFNGDGSGLLSPNDNITREQVFAVLARAFKLSDGDASVLAKFTDSGDISSWAKGYAAALVAGGYVNGSDGSLNPKSFITRAEFAQIMYNMIKNYIDTPQKLIGGYDGSVVVRASDVTITSGVTINGALIICEGCKNITLQDGAIFTMIIDNRPESEKKNNPLTPDQNDDKKEEDEKKDDIFWIIETPGTGSDSGTNVGNGGTLEEDDGNWSQIYRP